MIAQNVNVNNEVHLLFYLIHLYEVTNIISMHFSIIVEEFISYKNTKITILGYLVTAFPTAMFLAIISAVFLQFFFIIFTMQNNLYIVFKYFCIYWDTLWEQISWTWVYKMCIHHPFCIFAKELKKVYGNIKALKGWKLVNAERYL